MLSDSMQQKLLDQVQKEWESQFYYLEMMAWCYNNDFDGFGAWFERQAGEEHGHGMRIVHFVRDVGGEIKIPAVAPPPADFSDLQQLFELTLEHEVRVTRLVHECVNMALSEHDHTTHNFLQWFVTEQIEEEATARTILSRIKRAGNNPSALLLIEDQLVSGKMQKEPSVGDS